MSDNNGWLPISTAPAEGVFLVFMPKAKRMPVEVARWRPNVKVIGNKFDFDCAPVTMWKPIDYPEGYEPA